MKELKDYTEEELRKELRRRSDIKRVEARLKDRLRDHWKCWVGKVKKVKELEEGISVQRFRFYVEPLDEVICESFHYKSVRFKVKYKEFNLSNLPKVGDTVKLRYYIHKNGDDYIDESLIVEVVKRKGE